MVVGEGISGTITLDPTEISFDTVCIGQKVKKTLTLLNQADGMWFALEQWAAQRGRPGGVADQGAADAARRCHRHDPVRQWVGVQRAA